MKLFNKKHNCWLITVLILSISGCLSIGPSTLRFEDSLAPDTKSTNQITSNITLEKFKDVRTNNKTPELIGGKQVGLGMSPYDVSVERPIAEIIHNKFRRELISNVHSNNNIDENFTITGKILDFWIGTDVTALYWDVYGEVQIEIEIKNTKGESIKVGPHYEKKIERTYSGPSDTIMTKVILSSLDEVIKKILSDDNFTKMIPKKTK